jgi:hypothetical protein
MCVGAVFAKVLIASHFNQMERVSDLISQLFQFGQWNVIFDLL